MIDNQVSQLKQLFLQEIRQHLYMFDSFKICWELQLIENVTNKFNHKSDSTEYLLRFKLYKDVGNRIIEKQYTVYPHDFADFETNPLRLLQDMVFNWDYSKMYEFFNRKESEIDYDSK
jgi:hypothetical protein